MIRLSFPLALALLAGSPALFGETVPVAAPAAPAASDVELATLRAAHQQTLKAQQDAIAKKQLEALRALEKKRAEQGDYEGAQRVFSQLQELEKVSGTNVPAKSTAIILNAEKHHLTPYAVIEKNGFLQITKANATIRWDGLSLAVGTYMVKMTYSVGDLEALANPQSTAFTKAPVIHYRTDGTVIPPTYGGTVEFCEDTTINASTPVKTKIPSTLAPVPETTISLGNIHISSPRSSLMLKSLEADPEGVLNLKSLELTPESLPPAPPTEGRDFEQLQEDYHKQLNEKIGSVQRAWLAKLEELQKQAEASSNDEALVIIKNELAQLQGQARATAPPLPGATAPMKWLLQAGDPILVTYIGEIRLSNSRDCLQRLRPAKGARVSFNLGTAKVPPGKYMVSINVNVGPTMGGGYHLSCGSSVLRGKLETSPTYLNRELALPDPLTVASPYLEFAVDELLLSTGSLCDLKSIQLTPVP